MKKILSLTLCLAMVLVIASSAFASFRPIVNPGFTLPGGDIEPTTTLPTKVQAYVDAVEAIGTVTAESAPLIEAADAAYAAMKSGSAWVLYENEYGDAINEATATLDNAKKAYAALTATEAPTTAAPEAPTTAAPEAPTTAAPEAPTTAAPEAPTQPSTPSEPVDPAGDNTFMVLAMVVLSMTALVVLVSKKRAI